MALWAKASHFHISLSCRRNFIFNFKYRLKSWKVMFFGSDDFSLATLKELNKQLENGTIDKLEVVVSHTRNNPVLDYSNKKKLTIHYWPPTFVEYFDIGIVSSFGKLIPKDIIDHFPLGVLNIHGSLLPKYRGPMPVSHAIINGDDVTGISIMAIKPYKFDVGDVIMQETCLIGSNEVFPSLKNKLAALGTKCITHTLQSLPNCLETRKPQDSALATRAPKITKEFSMIEWDKMTAKELYNRYRGLYGIFDLTTSWCSERVKFICISLDFNKKFSVPCDSSKSLPGHLEYCRVNKCLRVHCTDKPIYICTLRFRNKLLTGFNFYRGYLQLKSKDEWVFK